MTFRSPPEQTKAPKPDKADQARLDALLASALRGNPAPWPASQNDSTFIEAVHERILFHGIASILFGNSHQLTGWPPALLARLRQDTLGRAMWEMRHKTAVAPALDALAQAGVTSLVLKGSALAYTLYPQPFLRTRGDTDLLVEASQLELTRQALSSLGWQRAPFFDEMSDALEESWSITAADGMEQTIDLHWQAMDAPALEELLPFQDCAAHAQSLDRFGDRARRMDYAMMMIHACVHRAKHRVTPYMVGDKVYHDGDRLIWLYDLDLLARACNEADWTRVCELSVRYDVAPICLEALETAHVFLMMPIPDQVRHRLAAAPERSGASDYLLKDRQFGRAWKNFLALKGTGRKLLYLRTKLAPSPSFMRDKYAHLPRVPVPLLYVWRILELFVRRPRERNS